MKKLNNLFSGFFRKYPLLVPIIAGCLSIAVWCLIVDEPSLFVRLVTAFCLAALFCICLLCGLIILAALIQSKVRKFWRFFLMAIYLIVFVLLFLHVLHPGMFPDLS
jgi:hypothetical protein